VEEGEVLGVAGVDGNGQKELVQGLLGLARASGSIRLGDVDISNLPTRDRLSLGIRVIPEDRHREAILESWNLVENAALGLQALPPISRRKFIDLRSVTSLAKRAADLFQTRYASLNQPIRGLSGGNQQRFVAGRALQLEPKLLLAFQPARGLDLDATQRLYDEIRARCRATGMAAIVIAFDLDELLSQADRIVVLHDGALLELPEGAPDRQVIGRLMVGAA
jgi:simple sugar transport system ATP-binding protein